MNIVYSIKARFKALIRLVGLGCVNLGCCYGNGIYAHLNVYNVLTNRFRTLKSTLILYEGARQFKLRLATVLYKHTILVAMVMSIGLMYYS